MVCEGRQFRRDASGRWWKARREQAVLVQDLTRCSFVDVILRLMASIPDANTVSMKDDRQR